MSVTRTFTVTVQSTGYGNKYLIDGVQQATLNLAEGGTYKFDQSDSSNNNHPLRFSTTDNGTHSGGSEYTTGVTTNGTPGDAGAYTQIVVAASAPTLYYYCTNHSGMGGQANTPAGNSWGVFSWSLNQYGDQDAVDASLTAPSGLTSSLGSVTPFTSNGWGGKTWGENTWGELGDDIVILSGISATASVGEVISGANQGWGRAEWGEEPWGESDNPVVTLDGNGLTSAIGAVTIQDEINAGWGQDGWGVENWGESALTVVVDVESSGVATTELPDTSWGAQGWGSSSDAGDVGVTWGGDFILNVADAMGLTGLSATSAIGSPTIILSPTVTLSAPSNLTSNVGAITVPADAAVGISGFGLTSAVGSITPSDAVGISSAGVLTTAVGELIVDESLIVSISGVGATSSVGSVITEVAYTLTAPTNLTSGVGAIAPADVVGLEGVEATISVGNLSPLGYKDIDITGNTSYTDVA